MDLQWTFLLKILNTQDYMEGTLTNSMKYRDNLSSWVEPIFSNVHCFTHPSRTVKFEVGRMQNAEDSQSAKSVAFSVRHLVRSDWCSYFVLRWRAEKKSRLPLTTTSLPAFLVVGNSVFTSWARRRYLHSVCGIMCFLLKSFHDMRKAVTLR